MKLKYNFTQILCQMMSIKQNNNQSGCSILVILVRLMLTRVSLIPNLAAQLLLFPKAELKDLHHALVQNCGQNGTKHK